MSRSFLFLLLGVSILGTAVIGSSARVRRTAEKEFRNQAVLSAQDAARTQAQVILYAQYKVAAGNTFTQSLVEDGVRPDDIAGIIGTARPVYDLRRVHAGNQLSIGRSVTGELRAIRYQIDPDRMLEIEPSDQGFAARVDAIPSHTQVSTVSGRISDSLFKAVSDAGETPELAFRLARIFAYDLDFYTDPREGDSFQVVVEKRTYLDGKTAGYGRIFAAEYKNGDHSYQALLFHDAAGNPAYYSPDGKSLQRAFLHSPLKFAAPITSRFSVSRFHPILKTYRPHLGVDYGAPTGTPVQTIGSGRVLFAGRKGGDGNMVHIVHSDGYETMYLHLSRILVRAGAHVTLGQTIGLVGMTGLATGPHLDFRILQHGEFRNFLALQLPFSDPVERRDWNEFASARDQWMPLLNPAPALAAAQTEGAPQAASVPSASSR